MVTLGVQLHPMPCRLRAIPARRHVAPPAPAVLRLILKDSPASRVGAAADSRELAEDERVRRALHNRNEQSGEGVANGDKGSRKGAVGAHLHAARAGTSAEDAVDLAERLEPYVLEFLALFGQGPQHGAHAAGVREHGKRPCGLLNGAPLHGARALGVEYVRGLEPMRKAAEVVQRIRPTRARVGVHEVEPEPFRDEGERMTVSMILMHERGGELEWG
jgi:hypothetical protein